MTRYRPRVRHAAALPVLVSAGWGWTAWHLAGLILAGAMAAVLWPLAILALLSAPPVLIGGMWPRRWRVASRSRRIDRGYGRGRSGYIPLWMRRAVYRADRYRCVYCGLRGDLQVDHIVPWACGGLTVLWNLATLCALHNRAKSCYYPPWDGRIAGPDAILRAEHRARRNPLRWLRMAFAL